jgi:hypothetical protein
MYLTYGDQEKVSLRNSRINEPIEITSFLEKYQGVLEEPHI